MADSISADAMQSALNTARNLEAQGQRAEARCQYELVAARIEDMQAGLARRIGGGTAIGFGLVSMLVPGGGLVAAAVWAGLGYLAGRKGTKVVSSAVYQDLRDEALEGRLRLRKVG